MSHLLRAPCPTLRPFVRSLGCVGGVLPAGRERILPTAHVSLMVNLHEDEFRTYDGPTGPPALRTRGAILAGPRLRHLVIDTEEQRSLVEVTFELGGAPHFFGVAMSAVRDRLVELEALWGREGRLLRERLLEAATPERRLSVIETALRDHLAQGCGLDPVVAAAAFHFERDLSVSAVAVELGISPRRFTSRFRERVGLGPKRYSRVRRLERLFGSIDPDVPPRWSEVAAAHGFSDQAHLVNEFREMTGVTPTGIGLAPRRSRTICRCRPADRFLQDHGRRRRLSSDHDL